MQNIIGKTIGKYSIVARLGGGGMGTVYKAHQPRLDRFVAIKVLHAHLAEDATFVSRFEREAVAIARLNHPNIVKIFDFDAEDGIYYMVMELLQGPTLKAEIEARHEQQQDFSLREMVKLSLALTDALTYAHASGVIHRDIKPSNIILTTDGRVVLTDFGLARILDTTQLTAPGVTSGTPEYMSPEQATGEIATERSDIYSLGVILYELAAHRLPFSGETPFASIVGHLNMKPTPPTHYNPNLPPLLEKVILTAMEKKTADRYPSADKMAAALREVLGASHLSITPVMVLAPSPDFESESGGETPSLPTPARPYRGLYAFREEDADFFFGRELFVERLVSTVRQNSLAVVVGPSGSGKSSVVFAGLVPQLRREAEWAITDFRPGSHPFQSLADALLPLLEPDTGEVDRLVETRKLAQALDEGALPLSDIAARILQKNAPAVRLLLVADQFEEIFTLCSDPEMRRRFTELLLMAVGAACSGTSPLALVLTLRADFVGQALNDRTLAEALQRADVKISPMTREELAQAIESPAAQLGVSFEPGLVERILDDVRNEPGNLPLLEFALSLMWDRRAGRRLTHAAYDAIGRVDGALARYAEKVYAKLGDEEKLLARRAFTQMVRPGNRTEDTRRSASRDELGDECWLLVQRLADERLVVTSLDANGQEVGEVIHEVLIRGWRRLQEWMEGDRAFRAWQERLRAGLRQWESGSHDEAALLRGSLLGEARDWLAARRSEIGSSEKEYIHASLSLADREAAEREAQRQQQLEAAQQLAQEQQRRAEESAASARRLRGRAWLLTGALVAAALLAILAINFAAQSNRNYQAAQGNAQTAEANARVAATAAAQAEASELLAEANARSAQENADLAQVNAQIALSRQLAAQSTSLLADQPDLALLTSLEANRLADNPETRSGLLSALQANEPLFTTLWGHAGSVQDSAFSPDGTRLATVGAEGIVRLWNVEIIEDGINISPRGEPLRGHSERDLVNTVGFSTDGKYIVTGSDDQTARLWDVETGKQTAVLTMTQIAQNLVVLPRENTVVMAGNSSLLYFWNIDTRTVVTVTHPHTDIVWFLDVNPDGSLLASGGLDGKIVLWDVKTRQQSAILPVGKEVWGLDFSPSGQLLAAATGSEEVSLWDVSSRELAGVITTTAIKTNACLFYDEQTLIVQDSNQQFGLWNTETNAAVRPTIHTHFTVMPSLTLSRDRRFLITGTGYGTLDVWDLSGETGLGKWTDVRHADSTGSIDYAPDGQTAVSGGYDGHIIRFDPYTGKTIGAPWVQAWPSQSGITSLALDPTGPHLAISFDDGNTVLWNFINDPQGTSLSLLGLANMLGNTTLTYRSDGAWVGKGGSDGQMISVSPLSGYTMLTPASHGAVTGMAYLLPIGIVSINEDGLLRRWGVDAYNFLPKVELTAHPEGATTLALSGEKTLVATGGKGGGISVWSVESGEKLWSAGEAHGGAVLALSFRQTEAGLTLRSVGADGRVLEWRLGSLETSLSPSDIPLVLVEAAPGPSSASLGGNGAAVGYADGRVQVWSLAAAPALLVTAQVGGAVTALALDDQHAFTGNAQGAVQMWNLESPAQAAELRFPGPLPVGVYTLRYSPDGKLLATAAFNGAIFLYDTASGKALPQQLLGHQSAPALNLAFSPDSQTLVSVACINLQPVPSCDQAELIAWNLVSGEMRYRLEIPVSRTLFKAHIGFGLAVSPDGKIVAVGGCAAADAIGYCSKGKAMLWNLETGQLLEESFAAQSQQIAGLDFSSNGKLLASLSDTELRVWDVATGAPVGQAWVESNSTGRTVAFSPDGKILASGWINRENSQGYIMLSDVSTGRQIGNPLTGWLGGVIGLRFSPDGQWLIGANRGGAEDNPNKILAWDLRLSVWRAHACRIVNRSLTAEEWKQYFNEAPYRQTCP